MPETKQNEAPDEPQTSSVYDFLYHDGRRIASFLAQFDPNGHLKELTQKFGTDESSTSDDTGGWRLGPRAAGVDGKFSDKNSTARRDDTIKVFDPTWSNAREFLNLLAQESLLERDVSQATIGQFVLFKGRLTIDDLQMMINIWGLPTVKKLMGGAKASLPEMPKAARSNPSLRAIHEAAVAEAKSNQLGSQLFMEMIPALPHTVQATVTGNEQVWCTLNREGLTFEPTDIVLKFGKSIPGEWAVIGILDAVPDSQPSGEIQNVDYLSGGGVAKLMDAVTPMVRTFLGRPYDAYGITPLLIFREVVGRE